MGGAHSCRCATPPREATPETKTPRSDDRGVEVRRLDEAPVEGSLTMTYFHAKKIALSSSLERFTVLFGLGRGGSTPLWSSDIGRLRGADIDAHLR